MAAEIRKPEADVAFVDVIGRACLVVQLQQIVVASLRERGVESRLHVGPIENLYSDDLGPDYVEHDEPSSRIQRQVGVAGRVPADRARCRVEMRAASLAAATSIHHLERWDLLRELGIRGRFDKRDELGDKPRRHHARKPSDERCPANE